MTARNVLGLLLGLTSLGLLGSGAAPAQAAVSDRPTGYFCAWGDGEGTGAMFKTRLSRATLGTWDDKFRMIMNRTSPFACTFEEPNYEDSAGRYGNDGRTTTIAGKSVDSVKIVPTIRECTDNACPHWLTETSPEATGFGDMNNDRRSDVLVRDLVGRLWFLPGDGSRRLIGTGGWNVFNAMVRHGDFSRDGREDVITREQATGRLWLYPGNGAGGLGARKLLGSGGWNGMTPLIANGDWSGDGRPDLLATERDSGLLYHYPGTGRGGLGAGDWLGGSRDDLNGAF
ncbi:peptidase inhibitor family I36 protein [Streptomyces sp. NPDC013012]|uniref:peptidase inhibitor family I36 protein n=1 Tax=Streptomyces sp. NPDC013012 TaxID=3364860 RepID=UPI0036A1BCAA